MVPVLMYTTRVCPYCARAKQLLGQYGVVAEEIHVDQNVAKRDEMISRTGMRTVPQIFINGVHIGGSEELAKLHNEGTLMAMLQG